LLAVDRGAAADQQRGNRDQKQQRSAHVQA
jgi:hypothetical protein